MDCGAGSSQNWGKSNVGLEGYFDRRNARIDPQAEYNDIDRKWRKKYLASQHLSANDNKIDLYRNADYKKWRYNIFRRIWRAPLDFVEFNVISKIYPDWTQARGVRHAISVFLGAWAIGVMGAYYGKYASDDWARRAGAKVYLGKPAIYPTSAEWPNAPSYARTSRDHYGVRNFNPKTDGLIKPSTPQF